MIFYNDLLTTFYYYSTAYVQTVDKAFLEKALLGKALLYPGVIEVTIRE